LSLPLAGKTVLVTRPRHQADDLIRPLEALGAEVVLMPAIEIAPPTDCGPLDLALRTLAAFDWVLVTSVNGVEAVRNRMDTLGIERASLSARKIAVVGPITSQAVEAAFRAPDVVPSEFVSEAIADALGDVRGKRFLLPRADRARRDIADVLRRRGAEVVEVVAYRIVRPATTQAISESTPDYITLTSSASVRNTRDALKERGLDHWMQSSRLVCIGPITEATVRELGYTPAATAAHYTVAGLVDALVGHAESLETTNA